MDREIHEPKIQVLREIHKYLEVKKWFIHWIDQEYKFINKWPTGSTAWKQMDTPGKPENDG